MLNFDPFLLSEQPVSLPDGLEELELLPAIQQLYSRNGRLQNLLEAERRRSEKQSEKELLELLDVVDALDRVLEFMDTVQEGEDVAEQIHDAIKTTQELLLQKLSKRGVQRMVLLGKPADLMIADVVDQEDKPGHMPGEVVAELVAAYTLGDVVVRRGKVIIKG